MENAVAIELNGNKYEIEVSKIVGAIDSVDPAFGKIAARRMKRGKISEVLNVLITCEHGHEINIEDVTDSMKEEYIKKHFVTTEEDEEQTIEEETTMKPTYYESMYDYVKNADLSYYEISDGTIRETLFIEEIKPIDDPDFILVADVIEHEEKCYVHVNFGENEDSYLLESALYDTVYLVYIEQSHGHYVAENGRVYETEEDAKNTF